MNSIERQILQLENRINEKMLLIESKSITPIESKIGRLFMVLKPYDNILHSKLMGEYKEILKKIEG